MNPIALTGRHAVSRIRDIPITEPVAVSQHASAE
jgi:hypothetical protein